jgi:hypothetical protein
LGDCRHFGFTVCARPSLRMMIARSR